MKLVTMEFDPESARNQRTEPLDASFSNISPLVFHHPSPCSCGLTLHGFFVPFTSYTMCPGAPMEQQMSSGFRASISNGVREDLVAASSQTNMQNQDPALNANFNYDFNFAQQVETTLLYPTPEHQDQQYETAAADAIQTQFHFPSQVSTIAHHPFPNDLDQNTTNNMLDFDIASEGINSSGSLDTNLSPASHSTNMSLPFHNFDQNTPNDISRSDIPGQEIEAHANIPSASPEMIFSEFNQTTPLRTPSPSSPTTPNTSNHSPSRQFCRLCRQTFKRPGDLKRHENVHFPDRRRFHCWQLGCKRNGRKGFFRRDKLRDHEKQVHHL
jgi:hypothetical protein